MICAYNKDEFCTNGQCPMCADYCPVPDTEDVCKYEERKEERYYLTPKGCLSLAFIHAGAHIDNETFDTLWEDFESLMSEHGYIQEED